jgi:hypothetical protein
MPSRARLLGVVRARRQKCASEEHRTGRGGSPEYIGPRGSPSTLLHTTAPLCVLCILVRVFNVTESEIVGEPG